MEPIETKATPEYRNMLTKESSLPVNDSIQNQNNHFKIFVVQIKIPEILIERTRSSWPQNGVILADLGLFWY